MSSFHFVAVTVDLWEVSTWSFEWKHITYKGRNSVWTLAEDITKLLVSVCLWIYFWTPSLVYRNFGTHRVSLKGTPEP